MSVLFSIVLALSVIALLWIYFTRTQDKEIGCQSDAISWKTYSTGESTDMSITTLFLFNNKGRCEQVPDMRSSYSSGAHPRGTS
ncbi:hypothetical protein [Escherichia coli]|uniref:hypothetical protein n=1 Tax=Escherichia coli TaxID=562 RepID=UPI000178A71A|nr:hypothetical protein [Escherichia coli]